VQPAPSGGRPQTAAHEAGVEAVEQVGTATLKVDAMKERASAPVLSA
jgi:hypothetical protein